MKSEVSLICIFMMASVSQRFAFFIFGTLLGLCHNLFLFVYFLGVYFYFDITAYSRY